MSQNVSEAVAPLHSHYVSLENSVIQPAMSYPSGYEDEHLNEWRPATATEINRYLAGEDRVAATSGFPSMPSEAPTASAPASVKMASDDPAPPPPTTGPGEAPLYQKSSKAPKPPASAESPAPPPPAPRTP